MGSTDAGRTDAGVVRLLEDWREADIPVLALMAPGAAAPRGSGDGTVIVLIPRPSAGAALRIAEDAGWRYELQTRGLWSFTRSASFLWDGGSSVDVNWGVPAAPLPGRSLRRLEEVLWAGARRTAGGWLEPDPETRLVLAAVQWARPGWRRRMWEAELARQAPQTLDWERVRATARDAGAGMALRRALEAVEGAPRSAIRALPTADLRGTVWRVAAALQTRVPSRTVKGLLVGAPLPGRATMRCRFGGVIVTVGPGVFVPREVSEGLIRETLRRTSGREHPIVVEVGTGCGAGALALAAAAGLEVHATDTARRALRWARRNQKALGAASVRWYEGSLLDPIPSRLRGRVDVIMANVPYVPASLRNPVWRDAPGSVMGRGHDGLGLHRELSWQAMEFLRPGGTLVMQLSGDQWPGFSCELDSLGYRAGEIVARRASDVVAWAELP